MIIVSEVDCMWLRCCMLRWMSVTIRNKVNNAYMRGSLKVVQDVEKFKRGMHILCGEIMKRRKYGWIVWKRIHLEGCEIRYDDW